MTKYVIYFVVFFTCGWDVSSKLEVPSCLDKYSYMWAPMLLILGSKYMIS